MKILPADAMNPDINEKLFLAHLKLERGDFLELVHDLNDILRSYSDIDSSNLIKIYHDLYIANRNIGRYNMALDYLQKESFIIQSISPEAWSSLASNVIAIGDINASMRLFTVAHKSYSKGYEFLNKMNRSDLDYRLRLILLELKIGNAYYKSRDYGEAINSFLKCASFNSERNVINCERIFEPLAKAYALNGEYELAESYFLKCEEIYVSNYSEDYFKLSSLYTDIGIFYQATYRNEESLEFYLRALYISIKNYGTKHPKTSEIYRLLGDHFFENREFKNALQYYQKSIYALAENLTDKRLYAIPDIIDLYFNNDMLELLLLKTHTLLIVSKSFSVDKNQPVEELSAAYETIGLYLDYIDLLEENYIPNNIRIIIEKNDEHVYNEFIEILLSLYEKTKNSKYLSELYLLVSERKEKETIIQNVENNDIFLESTINQIERKKKGIVNDLEACSLLIAKEKRKQHSDSLKLRSWKESYKDLNEQYYLLSTRSFYGIQINPKDHLDFNGRLSISKIQKGLRSNEVFIDYYFTENNFIAGSMCLVFIISRNNIYIHSSILSQTTRMDISRILEWNKRTNLDSLPSEEHRMYISSLYSVYFNLFKPIESYFSGKNLIICPNKELLGVPINGLIRTPPYSKSINYKELNYLVNEYTIRYCLVPSKLDKNEGKYKIRNFLKNNHEDNIILYRNYDNSIQTYSEFMSKTMNSGSHSIIALFSPILKDSESDKFIMGTYNKFFKWFRKSKALHKSQLKYLNQNNNLKDPYYWAGYQLFGNDYKMINPWRLICTVLSMIIVTYVVSKYSMWRTKN